MTRKEIVLICSRIPNPRISRRIRTIKSAGFSLTVIYWGRTHGFGLTLDKEPGVKYICFEARDIKNPLHRILEDMSLSYKTLNAIKKVSPSLVYVFDVECMPLAKIYSNRHKVPVVFEVADLPCAWQIRRMKLFGKILMRYVDNLVSSVSGLVVTSPYYWDMYYSRKIDIPRKDVFVFENVPEAKLFNLFKKTKHKDFVIGFVGGIRYLEALDALFIASQVAKNIKVLIAGTGPEIYAVKESASKFGNIEFLGAYVYSRDIASIYSKIDLLYSVYDSNMLNVRLALPNKLYEAIVCGIPIVVASGTSLQDYVEKLGIGFSVPYGDSNALSRLLLHILASKNLIDSISKIEMKMRDSYFYENIEPLFVDWLRRKLPVSNTDSSQLHLD